MDGLIQGQMPKSANGASASMSPDALMSQMHVNPQQQTQLQRIVAAGMKVMFDAKTHQMMIQQLQGDGPMPNKLGQGIAGLLGLLMKESQNSLPPNLLIPAGIVLLAHAADFLAKSDAPVSPQDFGGAVDVLVSTVLQQFGLDPNKVAQIAGSAEASAGAQGQGAAPAAQPGGGM